MMMMMKMLMFVVIVMLVSVGGVGSVDVASSHCDLHTDGSRGVESGSSGDDEMLLSGDVAALSSEGCCLCFSTVMSSALLFCVQVALVLALLVVCAVVLMSTAALVKGMRWARARDAQEGDKVAAAKNEKKTSTRTFTAAVVVLGDIGHSPRSANHAYSFATIQQAVHGARVGSTIGNNTTENVESCPFVCTRVHIAAEGDVSSLHNKLKGLFSTTSMSSRQGSSVRDSLESDDSASIQKRDLKESTTTSHKGIEADVELHQLYAWRPSKLVSKLVSPLPKAFEKVLKVVYQSLLLVYTLTIVMPRTDIALLQLPPSVPTLPICLFIFKLQRTKLILDWHNFGYTLLTMTAGRRSPLTLMTKVCEQSLGTFADCSICVTSAMKSVLASWGVEASVFYDRPPDQFCRSSIDETHELFKKYGLLQHISKTGSLLIPMDRCEASSSPTTLVSEEFFTLDNVMSKETTKFAHAVSEVQYLSHDRPAVIVSSTSWTPDEDFSILLDAAAEYDKKLSASTSTSTSKQYPDLLIVITGKGPQKAMYEEKLSCMSLNHVRFTTLWLDAEDYPILLGSADLGVCLHTSSSGLDLPMKVVDMFGCSLPVCAARFDCIEELVKPDINGKLFDDASSLCTNFFELLKGFPNVTPSLKKLQSGAAAWSEKKWASEWNEVVLELVEKVLK